MGWTPLVPYKPRLDLVLLLAPYGGFPRASEFWGNIFNYTPYISVYYSTVHCDNELDGQERDLVLCQAESSCASVQLGPGWNAVEFIQQMC